MPESSVGGLNGNYRVISNTKSFIDAKWDCRESGAELVTIDTLLTNVDVNVVCLDFMG